MADRTHQSINIKVMILYQYWHHIVSIYYIIYLFYFLWFHDESHEFGGIFLTTKTVYLTDGLSCVYLCSVVFICARVFLLYAPLFNCFYRCLCFPLVCAFVYLILSVPVFSLVCVFIILFLSVPVFSSCMYLCSIVFICAHDFLLYVPLFFCFGLCLCVYRLVCSIAVTSVHVCVLVQLDLSLLSALC
jgi:hypothetical protein